MAGLFGGARRALSNFAQTDDQGRTLGDKLSIIGATMRSVSDPGSGAIERQVDTQRKARQAQLEAARKAQANQILGGLFGGNQPAPSVDLEALSQGNLGQTDTEIAAQPRQLPTLGQAAGDLWRAGQLGGDVDTAISLLDKARPTIAVGPDGSAYDSRDQANVGRRFANRTNINGFVTDLNNPENEGRYLPQIGEGQRPLYDAQGNIAGVANLDGSVQAVAQREGAIAAAREASSNPYRLDTVMGPDGNPITTSRANILGGDPIRGQSKAEEAYAVDAAKAQAAREAQTTERASAAVRMLPTLDNMERLLPDVIAGWGADWRQGGARFLGAVGNDDAARRAASTEVFKNEARQLVANVIKTFGANPTEGERKYAEQMMGADVELTPQALQQGIQLVRERANRDIAAQRGAQAPADPARAARARELLRQRGVIQ